MILCGPVPESDATSGRGRASSRIDRGLCCEICVRPSVGMLSDSEDYYS